MTKRTRDRVYAALDEMLAAERGDAKGYPEPSSKKGDESAPKVDAPEPAYRTRSKTKASLASATGPSRSIPHYLQGLTIAPVSLGDLFESAAWRPHKFPLLIVRNERMTQYYGEQWYDRAQQSQSISSAV